MAPCSNICAWEIPWMEEPGGYSPCGHKESDVPEYVGTRASINKGMPTIASELPEVVRETQTYSPPNPQKKPNLLVP